MTNFGERDRELEQPAPAEQEAHPVVPLSQVAQLQQRLGNARLLQLRALQRQAVNPQEFIQQDIAAKAAAGKYDQLAMERAEEQVAIPGGGTPLPAGLAAHAQSHLGVPMHDVEVVHNGDAATKPLQAMAFTTHDAGVPKVVLGSDVDLKTPDGQFTLMHELTHVAQQKQGQSDGLHGMAGDAGQRAHL